MKKILFTSAIILVLITSCSKDDETITLESSAYITADIFYDDRTFDSTNPGQQEATLTNYDTNKYLIEMYLADKVEGGVADCKIIINNTPEVRIYSKANDGDKITFAISFLGGNLYATYSKLPLTDYTLEITAFNKNEGTIQGKFSAILRNLEDLTPLFVNISGGFTISRQ